MGSKSLDKLRKDMISQLQAEAGNIKKMFEVGEAILGKADNEMLARICENINIEASNRITMGFVKENVDGLKKEYADICDTIEGLE